MTNEFIDKLTNEQTDNNYYVTSLKKLALIVRRED